MVGCCSLRSIKDKITRRLSLSVENAEPQVLSHKCFPPKVRTNACQLDVVEGRQATRKNEGVEEKEGARVACWDLNFTALSFANNKRAARPANNCN